MITEDYVSFETAKLLKEKGFPQEYDIYHSMVYNEEDYEDEYEVQRMVLETRIVKAGTLSSYPVGVPEPKCYCPTLQMAKKWLRKVYKLHIITIPYAPIDRSSYHPGEADIVYIAQLFKGIIPKDEIGRSIIKLTDEKACEAAIKYCLEHLI